MAEEQATTPTQEIPEGSLELISKLEKKVEELNNKVEVLEKFAIHENRDSWRHVSQ